MSCSDPAAAGGGSRAALACFLAGFVFLLTTHFSFLRLPYHWDELGYFVPAAHDLLVSGALVPHSTLPNVHPPLVMLYLAGVWKLFGFAVPVTRVAMLALGAATLAAVFLLAGRLAGRRAAWTAAALLAVSPPFVAQSMLAHLDLAAALWVLLAVYWFVERRWLLCGVAATALALTKETGIILPVVLAVFGCAEKKRLLPLLVPFIALASWVLFLRSVTGHWLGNPEFERYNVSETLDPLRIPLVLLRRVYQLGFANFHWLGVGLLVVAFRKGKDVCAPWRLIGAVVAAYILLHSVTGGAILLRYLLPALALFYVATAAALEALRPSSRRAGLAVLLAGLVVSNWWNPPYPFSYEDNLAVTDFVRLQQQAARWLSEHSPDRAVTTAWPLTDALSNPLCGYVERPLKVKALDNFQPAAWMAVEADQVQVVALYSRNWEPEQGWQRWPPAARLVARYLGYERQLSREELIKRFRLQGVARWERRGQWMEILVSEEEASRN